MTDATPQTIYLSDYTPPAYLVDSVELTFDLHPTKTLVTSKIAFRPNPETTDRTFFLYGENLTLRSASIDGQDWKPKMVEGGLTTTVPDAPFIWRSQVEIDPSSNTALEGLYMSDGMYCTQCEAEGFRNITFYPDRPDVMSVFTVRIKSGEPFKLSNGDVVAGDGPFDVLLSNGNSLGVDAQGYHVWHDPWPKPAYLFALVAGDLVPHSGSFTTMSGKEVALNIYVRSGPDEDKCAFGMEALKRSMKWDEDVYGREYDLDIFNIVAVDNFNAGAMENKGLNIFNASYVLASPETAEDKDYGWIDTVIAHEYFHNWTGNRITCRDWFQLCLKEGLTVFRDQQYTGDQGSPAVKRIEDAIKMRSRQFREDGGPLAHPVRPESFIEINNFYTVTVYEKGAELIGMLKRLVGDDAYYKALDLYFTRHDGDAATIEDWLKVFADSTGRDLSQFKLWYAQAGTPRVTVTDRFENGTYTLNLTQDTPATPGQPDKAPMLIPIAVGLLAADGTEVLQTQVVELTEAAQSFTFEGLASKPIPSLLRDFSAPVILQRDQSNEERAFLMAHDTDPFNKWDAGRALARDVLCRMVTEDAAPDAAYLDGIAAILRDDSLDPAFRALAVSPPSEADLAQALHDCGTTPDPVAIHRASEALKLANAQHVQDILPRIIADCTVEGPYSPDAKSAGNRSLGRTALGLLTRLDGGDQAAKTYADADNMTMQLAGLAALMMIDKGEDQSAAFRQQWRKDRLVMDKWFSLTVALAAPEQAAATAQRLTQEDDFDKKNPNRFRAVFGTLAGHAAGFHDPTGASYRLMGEHLKQLDAINPQTTARMTAAFETWRRYDANRQAMMRDVLEDIAATAGLSRDTSEMVGRMLAV